MHRYENTGIIHTHTLPITNNTPTHRGRLHLQINRLTHTNTPLHTQILCPAIVLQRKPVSGGGGRILSSAEGERWAEGADGEKTPGWKDEAERRRRRKRKRKKRRRLTGGLISYKQFESEVIWGAEYVYEYKPGIKNHIKSWRGVLQGQFQINCSFWIKLN